MSEDPPDWDELVRVVPEMREETALLHRLGQSPHWRDAVLVADVKAQIERAREIGFVRGLNTAVGAPRVEDGKAVVDVHHLAPGEQPPGDQPWILYLTSGYG